MVSSSQGVLPIRNYYHGGLIERTRGKLSVLFALLLISWHSSSYFFTGSACLRQETILGKENIDYNVEEAAHEANNLTKVLFIAMGQAKFFATWYNRVVGVRDRVQNMKLSLLYGSYDDTLPARSFNHTNDEFAVDSTFLYIPGTTWTEARNRLALEALLLERARASEFDFWVFADDDVDLTCYYNDTNPTQNFTGSKCWANFANLLPLVPRRVTTVTVGGLHNGWTAATTADAMLAAIPRHHVPHLLPYTKLAPGTSEWVSQAVVFCLSQRFFPGSVWFAPKMTGLNPEHRPYPREGFNVAAIHQSTANSYDTYLPPKEFSEFCLTTVYNQQLNLVGPSENVEELEQQAFGRFPEVYYKYSKWQYYLVGLVARFQDWEKEQLEILHHEKDLEHGNETGITYA